MENYTKTCRFILSCNYSSKIIDPIQSRCAIFRFRQLSKEDIFKLIDKIAKAEDLKINEKAKQALFQISNGDCRRLENILQSSTALSKEITEDVVFSLAALAKPKEILEILDLAINNNFIKARDKLLDTILNYGLSGLDVIKQILREIYNLEIEDPKKMELITKCGEVEFRIVEGSDEFIQLESLLAYFALVGSK